MATQTKTTDPIDTATEKVAEFNEKTPRRSPSSTRRPPRTAARPAPPTSTPTRRPSSSSPTATRRPPARPRSSGCRPSPPRRPTSPARSPRPTRAPRATSSPAVDLRRTLLPPAAIPEPRCPTRVPRLSAFWPRTPRRPRSAPPAPSRSDPGRRGSRPPPPTPRDVLRRGTRPILLERLGRHLEVVGDRLQPPAPTARAARARSATDTGSRCRPGRRAGASSGPASRADGG